MGTFYKKLRFLGARSPLKLVYNGIQGAFRKIFGSACQKSISQKSTKGRFFGSAGGRILEGGASAHPSKSAPGSKQTGFGRFGRKYCKHESINFASSSYFPWVKIALLFKSLSNTMFKQPISKKESRETQTDKSNL